MALTIDIDTGRTALVDSIDSLMEVIDGLSEYDLFTPSRCHGWSRLDVVTHLVFGGTEILMGLASRGDDRPTVDAASYWRSYAQLTSDDDPVEELMAQRRRAMSYRRPDSVRAHLRDVFGAVRTGAVALDDRHVTWQGQTFTAGDFAASWAVEHAVHHLDLRLDDPPAPTALRLARATVDALLSVPTPPTWDDTRAVLIGAGRLPAADDGPHPDELPALG